MTGSEILCTAVRRAPPPKNLLRHVRAIHTCLLLELPRLVACHKVISSLQ